MKAQKETNIGDFDNGVDSDSVSEPVRSSELAVCAASAEESGLPANLLGVRPLLRRLIVPRLQVRVRESLDCVSDMSLTSIP